jgi:rhamnosyltransferase
VNEMDISIVILTKNAEGDLCRSLPVIFSQRTKFSYEVIIIDNESSDNTLELLKRFPVRNITVKESDFHHSKVRNLGVQVSKGRFLVLLTGDAIPCNELWLENLIIPLEKDSNAAGVYSRQIPKPDCSPIEARDIYLGAGPLRIIKAVDFSDPYQVEDYKNNIWSFIAFSNISSCYRKDLLKTYPFNEAISAVEDQEWCKRMIEKGHSFYYEPASCVLHSHNLTFKELFQRQRLFGKSFGYFVDSPYNRKISFVLLKSVKDALLDYSFLVSYPLTFFNKFIWIFKIPFARFIKNYAFYKGFKGENS